MKNVLFLICPSSKLEHFLRRKYKNAYFLTSLAAVFKLQEQPYVEELIDFIERESIGEVVVVNDVACRFVESVLSKQKGYGTYAENVLIELLIDHYAEIMDGNSVAVQKARLAERNVQRQLQALLSIDYFLQQVVLQKLQVKGLVTSMVAGRVEIVKTPKAVFSV